MSKEQPEDLPVRLAKRLCDGISTGHDWPNTDDELLRMQSAAELRRLHAENEALRAQIGQGVLIGWLYDWTHSSALGKPDEHFTSFTNDEVYARKHSNVRPVFDKQPQAPQQKPLTDEQDRALCEAYCNAASDEYFKARPQLDSSANRRIFYAGHRKAWIEWQAAHNIGEKK